MKVWRSLDEVPASLPHRVFSIGNFDGVHAGHRALLDSVRRRAKAASGTALVLTFEPHPTRVIAPERAPRLLTPLDVKLDLLAGAGVAGTLVLPFTAEFSHLTPEQFAREILAIALGAKEIVVGENFRFGHKHAGDVAALARFGKELGFAVQTLGPVKMRGHAVSSSRIRDQLTAGRVPPANRMLERCFSVRGRIVPGRQIGRAQTVPTLNLEPYAELLPAAGVYITETTCGGVRGPSVTNIGISPTFLSPLQSGRVDGHDLRVESFLLEGAPPANAEEMEIFFWRRLRAERKFPSPEALKQQILRDVAAARKFFRRIPAGAGRSIA